MNVIAECSVDSFKRAALEFICLNLEIMLELRLLDELDEELFDELNDVVRANQLSFLPFARSGHEEEILFDHHPDLYAQIEASKQRRVDSMRPRSRLTEDEDRFANAKLRVGSLERTASSPLSRGHMPTPTDVSPVVTQAPVRQSGLLMGRMTSPSIWTMTTHASFLLQLLHWKIRHLHNSDHLDSVLSLRRQQEKRDQELLLKRAPFRREALIALKCSFLVARSPP